MASESDREQETIDVIVQQQEQYFQVDYVRHLGDIYNVFYDVLFDLLDQSRQELRKSVQGVEDARDTSHKRDCEVIDRSLEQLSQRMATVLESNYDAFEILCRDIFVLPKNFNRNTARVFQEISQRNRNAEQQQQQQQHGNMAAVPMDRDHIVAQIRTQYDLPQQDTANSDEEDDEKIIVDALREMRVQINSEVKRHLELQEEETQLQHNLKVFEHNKDRLTVIDRVLENKEDLTQDMMRRIVKEYDTLRDLAVRCKSLWNEVESRQLYRAAQSASTSTVTMGTSSGEASSEVNTQIQREEEELRKQVDQQARIDPNIQTMLDMMDEGED